MKSFRSHPSRKVVTVTSAVAVLALVSAITHADLAPWMQGVASGSAIEAALYRAMDLPGVRTLFPRPPAEAKGQLDALVQQKPEAAELYALRAHVDEQALDFDAAERDWKQYVAHAGDKASAEFELADFYARRDQAPEEIVTLEEAAAAPAAASEKFVAADKQSSWAAYTRALAVARQQGLGDDAVLAIHKAWIARYPAEPAARAALLSALLAMHRYAEAQHAIDDYGAAFPQDEVFPIKAAALLAFDEGTPDATERALGMFDKAYRPLWSADLMQSYFELLSTTRRQHAFVTTNQALLLKNPDDLIAATKVFNYYQQQGRVDAAGNSLAQYAASKDARHAAWTADELYTFATLLERTSQQQEAARYYFALASTSGSLRESKESTQEVGLSGLIRVLLLAPDQPIDLGAGNLAIYRDMATTDSGPGYLNGILSLWLNSATPSSEFADEEKKATPYFHRAKAAELLADLDRRFPSAENRPELHAMLIQSYVEYGQDSAVQTEGTKFLANFPSSPEMLTLRMQVAMEVADADARLDKTQAEFALYDGLLTELAAPLHGMPLSAAGISSPPPTAPAAAEGDGDATPTALAAKGSPAALLLQQSLTVPSAAPPSTAAAAAEYQQVLERYLGRLTTTGHLPDALAVLRRELDRNPNDPLLYERLATFLDQNNFAAQEEEVYRRAMTRFDDQSFYDRLARFYLRQRRKQDFDQLTRKVVDIFHDSDLQKYFAAVDRTWPQEYLELNLYAHARFPHDLTFTRNLLAAYQTKGTADPAAREKLLREHWEESADLQAEFFDLLARGNKLQQELSALQALVPSAADQQQNPAATRELAEIDLWQSHFEQSAPLLGELSAAYPSDVSVGENAHSVYRSLAYFDPSQIQHAVAIEKNLSAADPTDLDRLATIGDTYADSTATSLNLDASGQIAQAAPYWRSMGAVHPGVADGYLQAATVFWDYFQFDDALAELNVARTHFHNPALYGYQAGAIYENRRNYQKAIAEYIAAAMADPADDSSSSASARLVTLASRKEFADLVDKATQDALILHPTLAALQLRVSVMKARQSRAELGPLLEASIANARTVDEIAALAQYSETLNLPRAQEGALLREIKMTADPVESIQLQYQLAQVYETQKDTISATRLMEQVYAAHPKIVGVVRSTVDFYWSNQEPKQAIVTLLRASHEANPELAHDFTLEAIAKSNQSGDYVGARSILAPMLESDPYNAKYLGLQADSYAQAHDNVGLREFYVEKIAALKSAPLPVIEKRDKIATAREGLIPALTSLKDYGGALDQQIALVSAFPEDDAKLQDAASFARLHGLEKQLLAFLNKAVADSPRDSRFAIDLARVDVQFEDYDGAQLAYSKAIAIRSDRPDLYIARADLEEHQQNFDAACADYNRLYFLSYSDSQWMEKIALARARQGKPDLAVKALQTAWIDGRPVSAVNEFRVAQKLEEWDLLPQADEFAEVGVKLAGADLLTNSQYETGVTIYARLLARERKAPQALDFFAKLLKLGGGSVDSPAIVVRQVEQRGLASVTNEDWRKQLVARRAAQAKSSYNSAVQELCGVVARYYTPEEKSQFALVLDARRANRPALEVVETWIPAATAANLSDREAAWRRDILLHGDSLASSQLEPYEQLESARMEYTTLAQTLDEYASQVTAEGRPNVLAKAAAAWRNAGDRSHEVADLQKVVLSGKEQQLEQRLFVLYLHGDSSALLRLTAAKDTEGDDAANYLLAHGTTEQAYEAVKNRAAFHPSVWGNATLALTGLYFGDITPRIDAAFGSALADRTIGDRLSATADRDAQLVGQPWFYYGTRYGLFLKLAERPAHDAEDYLPAVLEQASSNSGSYTSLAETYLDAHEPDQAIVEYRHVLELTPDDPSPLVAIARVQFRAGRRDASLATYGEALDKLRSMVDTSSVPEEFWTNMATICSDARDGAFGSVLQSKIQDIVAAYIHKNGQYRSFELLHSAYVLVASKTPDEAARLVMQLIGGAEPDAQLELLGELTVAQNWYPQSLMEAVYLREIALAQAEAAHKPADAPQAGDDGGSPDAGVDSSGGVHEIQIAYVKWLLVHGRTEQAQRVLDSMPLAQRNDEGRKTLEVFLAARESRLAPLLASFASEPGRAPSLETLSSIANSLRLRDDTPSSRLLLEFIFQRKFEAQELQDVDYLSLAEARLDTNDVPGALDLLRRLTLQGSLYENLDSAAGLLERTGHTAEAVPLLQKLSRATPWSSELRLRLGLAERALHAQDAEPSLTTVAANPQAPYDIRASAATALQPLTGAKHFDSAELTSLAAGAVTGQHASQAYFVYAPTMAAQKATPADARSLLREALAAAPGSMRPWLRLQIFRADIAQQNFAEAAVVIDPVLSSNAWLRSAKPMLDEESFDVNAGTSNASVPEGDEARAPYSVSMALSGDADRCNFLQSLAMMEAHLDDNPTAASDLQAAMSLTSDVVLKRTMQDELRERSARETLAAMNEQRRPVIGDSLEQSVVVRPRLASMPAPSISVEVPQ